jgi:hypothetical protein
MQQNDTLAYLDITCMGVDCSTPADYVARILEKNRTLKVLKCSVAVYDPVAYEAVDRNPVILELSFLSNTVRNHRNAHNRTCRKTTLASLFF